MRLIDALKVITEIERFKGYLDEDMMLRIKIAINRLPTIEAEPIKHGKWIWVEDVPLEDGETEYDRESFYQCSECDAYDLRLKDCHADYCWSCGAKMEVNDEL